MTEEEGEEAPITLKRKRLPCRQATEAPPRAASKAIAPPTPTTNLTEWLGRVLNYDANQLTLLKRDYQYEPASCPGNEAPCDEEEKHSAHCVLCLKREIIDAAAQMDGIPQDEWYELMRWYKAGRQFRLSFTEEEVSNCVCGHDISHKHILLNTINDREVIVGSTCVEHFLNHGHAPCRRCGRDRSIHELWYYDMDQAICTQCLKRTSCIHDGCAEDAIARVIWTRRLVTRTVTGWLCVKHKGESDVKNFCKVHNQGYVKQCARCKPALSVAEKEVIERKHREAELKRQRTETASREHLRTDARLRVNAKKSVVYLQSALRKELTEEEQEELAEIQEEDRLQEEAEAAAEEEEAEEDSS